MVAAQAHARKWIGCDIDSNAYGLCMSRLASQIKLIPGRDFAIGDQAFLEKQFSVVASTSAIATTQRLKRIESRDVEPPESSAEAVALLATLDELKPGRDDAKHVEKTLASLAEYNTFTTPDDFGRTPGLTTSNSVLDRWRDEQIRHLISAPRYSPRIFISYRRDDTAAGHAGRLRADLARRYGKDKVFMDLASEPGVDFVDTLEDAVGSCSALLAVIGRNWLTVTDAKTEKRRLDNPWDWARIEVATALRRNIRVIPVLFHHAQMPSADDLPDDLKPLARRNAHEITDSRWEYDTANLVEVLDKIVGFKK